MRAATGRIVATCLSLCYLAGCANPAFREGRGLAADGNLEAALPKLQLAASQEPTNSEYQLAYLGTRDRLILQWLGEADSARRSGKADTAEQFYKQVMSVDPNNARARDGLADLERDARHGAWLAEAESALKKNDTDTAWARVRTVLNENPDHPTARQLARALSDKTAPPVAPTRLAAGLSKPLTIEFKDAPLKQIFEILSRTSGLNFVFDKEVKGEQRATIFLRNTSVQEALNLLMLTNQLEQRVLDGNSILIYPNAAAKLKDYQPLTVKTFLLSNVDAKTASNTLKTILKAKDLVVDEKQNLIVMRDTVDAIRIAEKLLAVQDQAEPEIMLDVAILEVTRSSLLNLGVQWPNQLALSPLAGAGGNVTLYDLRHLHQDMVGAVLPAMTIHADKQDGNVNILANPRIRARNRETAKIMIGDKIPNITSTSTATGFVAENIQYVDVGLKLEVQPTVNADNEVAIRIALEVSSIVDKFQTKSGSLAYQIGTRNASTLLKLRDGENQILAGLIRNDETSTGNRVPGLGEIPVLGRLFGSQNDSATKTEIVLSITPRLIRNARRPDATLLEFESGTDGNLKLPMALPGSGGSVVVGAATTAGSVASRSAMPASLDSAVSPGTAAAGTSTLTFQAPAQATVGSVFAVRLMIEPGEPVASIPVALSFDAKALEVVSVNEGNFLKQGGATTNFSQRVDKGSGQIFATATRAGKDGASAPGQVLELSLRALAPSPGARISIGAIAPVGLGGRSVNVAPPAPLMLPISQ